ncbi:hypothetical protein M422DRAFT_199375 [Sphaerobolus stellatus SS14]|nr:hypothetical protein M422DRAFT_199375 [Sphaerobolus stellatus SS14]
MRILTWNINGVRTVPQFYPWNELKTGDAILDELKADIICFQEMKIQRPSLEKTLALPTDYDSFFSFPVNKGGYSGVAVYTKKATVASLKAEEGLTGKLQPKVPLTPAEKISLQYPNTSEMTLYPDENNTVPRDLIELDNEGRALVLDFGLFVLINVYCPAETNEARLPYKMNFHLLLQERVRILMEEGREVIVVGDINITAAPIDHCDGELPSQKDDFWGRPPRAWFKNWLEPNGPMNDVIRKIWPDRKGMYTCWNTKIFARASNYGTRIDYVLLTPGLLPWFKHGDIQPAIHGSDHCPVFVDLHEEIQLSSGETVKLRDAMKYEHARGQPPRIAACFWDEFKQKLLSSFFTSSKTKGTPTPIIYTSPGPSPSLPISSASLSDLSTPPDTQTSPSKEASGVILSGSPMSIPISAIDPNPDAVNKPVDSPLVNMVSSSLSQLKSISTKKNKRTESDEPPLPSKKKKQKVGQQKISSFFAKPSVSSAKPSASSSSKPGRSRSFSNEDIIDVDASDKVLAQEDSSQIEEDRKLALSLSEEAATESTVVSLEQSGSQSKAVWGQLFAPIQPPKCTVHGETCKQYTVGKPGPNKGKTFFICSRPVGPGYDKGASERPREEVDPQYRCNFFKWTSDVKKEATKQQNGTVKRH